MPSVLDGWETPDVYCVVLTLLFLGLISLLWIFGCNGDSFLVSFFRSTSRRHHHLNINKEVPSKPFPKRQSLKPPEPIKLLAVGQSWKPFPNLQLEITRVAINPNIFVVRQFVVNPDDCRVMINYSRASGLLKYAKTTKGQESGRKHSHLCWIRSHELAQDWTALAFYLFLHQTTDNCTISEDLQVLRYEPNGKYELHHDGLGRVVTCLTYLNGVAGTWFPFARISQEEKEDKDANLDDKRRPLLVGQDGIWLAGKEAEGTKRLKSARSEHVIKIQPGDAVVFYNYCYQQQSNEIIENRRAEHMGMTTDREKWIATNWFRSDRIVDSHCATDEDWRKKHASS